MIPTMIVFGALFGRWPWLALAAAAVVWPALLIVTDVMDVERGLVVAAGLGVANAAVGVVVHQCVLFAVRRVRQRAAAG